MKEKKEKPYTSFWLPVGISLGTGLGALFGNVGLGMIFGVAAGTMLNLISYYHSKA
jgi:hypothetical protein